MSVKSKNIHVLPTDKPSKLFYNVGGALLFTKWDNYNGVNIYITSDEEIKEGDWVLFISTNEVIKVPLGGFKGKVCKKIILTTDRDLIKDGVQAIDDTFLEWFVKNPSCEEVKTLKVWWSDNTYSYDIIVPKEEPKQSTKNRILSETSEKTKQKARNYGNSLITKLNMTSNRIKEIQAETAYPQSRSVHQALLKVWNECEQKQERMYSEEEVIKISLALTFDLGIICKTSEVVEFIKQFKNK